MRRGASVQRRIRSGRQWLSFDRRRALPALPCICPALHALKQELVDLVSDDQEIMLFAELQEFISAFGAQALTARVVVARNGVEKRRLMDIQLGLQDLDIESVVVDRDADNIKTMIAKDLKREKITGLFNKNGIPWPRKHG